MTPIRKPITPRRFLKILAAVACAALPAAAFAQRAVPTAAPPPCGPVAVEPCAPVETAPPTFAPTCSGSERATQAPSFQFGNFSAFATVSDRANFSDRVRERVRFRSVAKRRGGCFANARAARSANVAIRVSTANVANACAPVVAPPCGPNGCSVDF